ncbi:hypothetical protein PHYPSEUDO_014420 [Phytophthora pseudosyringae]|uniref:RxLR effector protein n=1 Tax=Phytophthora pseudosyringae TaxID=221518 RepID=A0A8T1V507_9STRA|nr:hypothetical protein PHYPSEUDO_014420 [Phytophthora pseudosyringae]
MAQYYVVLLTVVALLASFDAASAVPDAKQLAMPKAAALSRMLSSDQQVARRFLRVSKAGGESDATADSEERAMGNEFAHALNHFDGVAKSGAKQYYDFSFSKWFSQLRKKITAKLRGRSRTREDDAGIHHLAIKNHANYDDSSSEHRTAKTF